MVSIVTIMCLSVISNTANLLFAGCVLDTKSLKVNVIAFAVPLIFKTLLKKRK